MTFSLEPNFLYVFTVKVGRGEGAEMPAGVAGAVVAVYAAAPDPDTAVRNGIAALGGMKFIFQEIQGDVGQLPIEYWDAYIEKVWPDFPERFPKSDELPGLLQSRAVFFGPFAAFTN